MHLKITRNFRLSNIRIRTTIRKINSKDDLKNLIAYNVSDVVNLEKLFDHNIYTSNFENKLMLMENYPEIIYQKMIKNINL